ncbi:TIGR01777 family oxidoreductase [Spongisporangium articulatum]|uniref:TIGR01777 family oxidoreductase n=1 Tax=Spongisporangium articulatum TaxID=3362603 RepID=A0ABW8AV82_9ACTN
MRIVITGSHGLIGSALVTALRASGHDVVKLVRSRPQAPDEVQWDPTGFVGGPLGSIDTDALGVVDAAVNLAGAGVGDKRWNDGYKREIHDSRTVGTATLVAALTAMDPLPKVLVSGSAQGVYGDRGDEVLTEDSAPGESFLADVVLDWEAAARPAAEAGIRVVHPRTSLVMAPHGGAFQPLARLIKLGLGGPLGNGKQWWSWITLPDTVAALQHMLDSDLSGPVNLASPEPARNRELIGALAAALHRPALLPAPSFALRAAVGEFAGEILASARLSPQKLTDSGFGFAHPTVESAARWFADS